MVKSLAPEFTSRGFSHKLIERTGNVAIYERTKPHFSRSHFEVVRIRVAKACTFKGQAVPAREVYPPSESWGTLGFTYDDLASAKQRAATLSRPGNRNAP